MKASPEGRLIVTPDPRFLKPRESASRVCNFPCPSFELAVASAALAASFMTGYSELNLQLWISLDKTRLF